jgi:hypothetical protein
MPYAGWAVTRRNNSGPIERPRSLGARLGADGVTPLMTSVEKMSVHETRAEWAATLSGKAQVKLKPLVSWEAI